MSEKIISVLDGSPLTMFPMWKTDCEYSANDRVRYNGVPVYHALNDLIGVYVEVVN